MRPVETIDLLKELYNKCKDGSYSIQLQLLAWHIHQNIFPAIGFTYLPLNMRSSVNPAPPHVSA